jgi:hypothetical protein
MAGRRGFPECLEGETEAAGDSQEPRAAPVVGFRSPPADPRPWRASGGPGEDRSPAGLHEIRDRIRRCREARNRPAVRGELAGEARRVDF